MTDGTADDPVTSHPVDYFGSEGGPSGSLEMHVAKPIVETPAPNINNESIPTPKPNEGQHKPTLKEDLAVGRVRTALAREYTPMSGDLHPELTAQMMVDNQKIMEDERKERDPRHPIMKIINGILELFGR